MTLWILNVRMLSNFFAILRGPLTAELALPTPVLCLSGLGCQITAVKVTLCSS